jgi:phosphopantetheine adenylyltransferase
MTIQVASEVVMQSGVVEHDVVKLARGARRAIQTKSTTRGTRRVFEKTPDKVGEEGTAAAHHPVLGLQAPAHELVDEVNRENVPIVALNSDTRQTHDKRRLDVIERIHTRNTPHNTARLAATRAVRVRDHQSIIVCIRPTKHESNRPISSTHTHSSTRSALDRQRCSRFQRECGPSSSLTCRTRS